MDQFEWLNKNSRYFSVELNGYKRPPADAYASTLKLINKEGKILDLGMGNGMLLKFIMLFSGLELIPFGVEINPRATEQAKKEILPEFADNFFETDVRNFGFQQGPFDIIITNPYYGEPNLNQYIERCKNNLAPEGRLILRLHQDVIENKGIPNLKHMTTVQGKGIVHGIILSGK